jgi:hypothetical protein
MFIPCTIRTSFSPVFVPTRSSVRVTLMRHELHTLAGQIVRDADATRAEGRDDVASRLDWRVADLREAAR